LLARSAHLGGYTTGTDFLREARARLATSFEIRFANPAGVWKPSAAELNCAAKVCSGASPAVLVDRDELPERVELCRPVVAKGMTANGASCSFS
jgi:hypothetical protein